MGIGYSLINMVIIKSEILLKYTQGEQLSHREPIYAIKACRLVFIIFLYKWVCLQNTYTM